MGLGNTSILLCWDFPSFLVPKIIGNFQWYSDIPSGIEVTSQ